MSDDLLTDAQLHKMLAAQVAEAGGARKWLRKHKLTSYKHAEHMFDNGDAATLDRVLPILGYKPVRRYQRIVSTPITGETDCATQSSNR